MLVYLADRLVEAHSRQLAARARIADELLEDGLVQQVRPTGRTRPVVREVIERLVMELEQRIRVTGHCVVPAARIPGPAEIGAAQPIPDRRVLQRYRQLGAERAGRSEGRLHRIDCPVAARE